MTTPFKRFRYGDAKPQKAPFVVGVQVNEGDMMYIDSLTPTNVTTPDGITAYAQRPASTLAMSTAIADPTSAVTVAAVSASGYGPGFTVASTGYKVAYTLVTADGLESGPNTLSAAMSTTGNAIQVTGVTVPTGIAQVYYYVTTDGGGAGTLKRVNVQPYGNGVIIGGPPPSDAPAPASASSLTALLLTQVAFAKLFFGVSGQTNLAASTLAQEAYGVKDGYIKTDTGGVFDFACSSASWNVGDLIGIGTLTGSVLDSQTVAKVSYLAAAVARCVQGGNSITTVRGAIVASTKVMTAHNF